MITIATKQHIREIRILWQEAYGDDIGYINLFLNKRAEYKNTLLSVKNHRVCGMLFILPCELMFLESSYQCAYFYAIATKKENRGQGISTELLQYAYELCERRGYDVCTLVPASNSLFRFYNKRGYATQGYIRTLSVRGEELEGALDSVIFSPVSAHKIYEERKNFFRHAYLVWNEKAMLNILEENEYCGGHFYRYDFKGKSGYICYQPMEESLVVKEYVGEESILNEILKCLHKHYQKKNYMCRLSDRADIGVQTPFAMTRWIRKETDMPFYIAHVLD